MFIRAKKHPNTNKVTVLICHSKREGRKVIQLVLSNIGYGSTAEEIEKLKQLAQQKLLLLKQHQHAKIINMSQNQTLLKNVEEVSRKHVGIKDIFGNLFDKLGFSDILENKDSDTLKALIMARITEPSSKLRACKILQNKFGLDLTVDTIYRLLDKLQENADKFERKVFESTKKVESTIDLMFFDVTTLYLETCATDELRNFGYSKDCKFNKTQVVLALATTKTGLPIGYKLFPGNTAEISTLIECVKKWKKQLQIDQVTFVADRGMMSAANIELLKENNMNFVVACPLKKLSEANKKIILEDKGYHLAAIGENNFSWIKELKLSDDHRLIVTYNSSRHRKDQADREKLIDRISKKLGKNHNPKKLISNKGYIKYTTIADESIASLDEDKIKAAQQWDGLHGVLTNLELPANQIVERYKHLWIIEESFRINKHNLKMRPIYHHSANRIKSHILLCFLTFTILRHAQIILQKSGMSMSINSLRDELIDIQASILCDTSSGELFRMSSAVSENIKNIYSIFNVSLGGKIEYY
jgi:transposase